MKLYFIFLMAFLIFSGCTHTSPFQTTDSEKISEKSTRSVANESSGDWITDLPNSEKYQDYMPEVTKQVGALLKRSSNDEFVRSLSTRISMYTAFAMSGCAPTSGANVKNCTLDFTPKKFIDKLMASSTQFIFCKDITDIKCIEKSPQIPIRAAHRQDSKPGLGEAKVLPVKLDSITEYSFTEKILTPKSEMYNLLNQTMAARLAEKIRKDGQTGIYGAVYGIDDHERSMKSVYDALVEKIRAGVDVKAVFDTEFAVADQSKERKNLFPMIFSYGKPKSSLDQNRWFFTPIEVASKMPYQTVLPFQYSGGTQGLIRELAANAKNFDEVKGRIEWPDSGIMHNKFLILKNKNQMSVWTGTANVSDTCMGTERNSNMSVYIKNNEIAQSFYEEFQEMYEYALTGPEGSAKAVIDGNYPFKYGRFKRNKRPNTHRYFTLTEGTATKEDDTDFRVYFSPTDDGEHRSIIPMLQSAKAGDIIRISMFGAAGMEGVRALQLAASRGVNIEVVIDSPTGFIAGSWVTNSKADATLREQNPFTGNATPGMISIKTNTRGPGDAWKQNHQKIGLLLRKIPNETYSQYVPGKDNGKYIAEQIIVGSQNWSAAGNDTSDENLVAIRNPKLGVKMGAAFSKYFTTLLWPNGKNLSDPSAADIQEIRNEAE